MDTFMCEVNVKVKALVCLAGRGVEAKFERKNCESISNTVC